MPTLPAHQQLHSKLFSIKTSVVLDKKQELWVRLASTSRIAYMHAAHRSSTPCALQDVQMTSTQKLSNVAIHGLTSEILVAYGSPYLSSHSMHVSRSKSGLRPCCHHRESRLSIRWVVYVSFWINAWQRAV